MSWNEGVGRGRVGNSERRGRFIRSRCRNHRGCAKGRALRDRQLRKCPRIWELLGQKKAAELLQTTLDEESEANELLNGLAGSIVNPETLMESELTGADRTS